MTMNLVARRETPPSQGWRVRRAWEFVHPRRATGWLVLVAALAAGCASAPPRPPAPPTPPQPGAIHGALIRLYDGPVARDEKIRDAAVTFAGRTFTSDLSGNVVVDALLAGVYEACAEPKGFKRGCQTGTVPGPPFDLVLERDVPPILPLRIDGRFLVTSEGSFRGLFQSGLTLLVRPPAERDAFLDQTRDLGLNGVRVFAGALTWAGQTPEGARAALPDLLEAAAARGLRVQVAAITDSATGYDVAAHLRAVSAIVAAHPNAILEIANEPGHATQAPAVQDIRNLTRLALDNVPSGVIYALGHLSDEPVDGAWPWQTLGGVITAHLSRDRDLWNRVRRMREIAAIGELTHWPVISGEPDAIAETQPPGKTRIIGEEAVSWSFALGALCRGFEIAVCVLHSEDGLMGRLLGPNEQRAARAYVEAFRAFDTEDRLEFRNAGWVGSPVRSARFAEQPPPNVVRAYSFVAGASGWTVLVGVTGDPAVEWSNGWRPGRVVAERPGVRILEIMR